MPWFGRCSMTVAPACASLRRRCRRLSRRRRRGPGDGRRRRARRRRSAALRCIRESARRSSREGDRSLPVHGRLDVPDAPVLDPGRVERGLDRGEAVRRDRGEEPARRLRIVGEDDELGGDVVGRERSPGRTKRRLWAAPPVSTPARARSSAPVSAGSASASNTNRVPDARAISRPWPSSPKPVTSVAPAIPLVDEDLRGRPIERPHLVDGAGEVGLGRLRPGGGR